MNLLKLTQSKRTLTVQVALNDNSIAAMHTPMETPIVSARNLRFSSFVYGGQHVLLGIVGEHS